MPSFVTINGSKRWRGTKDVRGKRQVAKKDLQWRRLKRIFDTFEGKYHSVWRVVKR